MDHGSSKRSIYAALAANLAIAIAKFIGASLSGSSAMLSEGFHSVVDSTNELLLLHGLKQSEAEPDEDYPLGRGQEVYFWALMVAVLIFALGGGFSIYEGVQSLQHPEPSRNFAVSYGVLAIAALFEGIALFISVREFNRARPASLTFWQALRKSKDPTTFVVIFEDAAALVGLALAAIGLGVSEWQHNTQYDGIASILIGLLLIIVAVVLVFETKGLLLGESALPETRASIKQIVQNDPAVAALGPPITIHLGPTDVLLALNIEFQDELAADQIEAAIRRIEAKIRDAHGEIKRIFIEAASIV
jgi:cation diffusion facilitator family transporter